MKLEDTENRFDDRRSYIEQNATGNREEIVRCNEGVIAGDDADVTASLARWIRSQKSLK